MKKYILYIFCFCFIHRVQAQSNGSFKIDLHFAQTQRPELSNYLNAITDSMQIGEELDIKAGMGIGFDMVFGNNHMEFEAGGGFTRSADEVGSDTANLLYYKNVDITYNFGANYLPVNFFLLGGSFIINSANANCSQTGLGTGDKYLEPLPSTDFNIFRGYSVAVKAQSGFYINLNEEDGNRLRLTGYYIYGLSNYNFYTVSEKRLSGYIGDPKTSFTSAGIELAVLFGF